MHFSRNANNGPINPMRGGQHFSFWRTEFKKENFKTDTHFLFLVPTWCTKWTHT
ncbi:hypothetical protein ALT785_850033 [Alteromonas infernus]